MHSGLLGHIKAVLPVLLDSLLDGSRHLGLQVHLEIGVLLDKVLVDVDGRAALILDLLKLMF